MNDTASLYGIRGGSLTSQCEAPTLAGARHSRQKAFAMNGSALWHSRSMRTSHAYMSPSVHNRRPIYFLHRTVPQAVQQTWRLRKVCPALGIAVD